MFDFHDFISSGSHLAMAGFMLFIGCIMLRLARRHTHLQWLSILIYAGSAVMLYLFSGFFHSINYINGEDRRVWQLLDQTAIFALIYGSNVPLMVYFLPPRRRNWLLVLMGGIALLGAMCLWLKPKHEILVAAYVSIGLLGLLPVRTYFRYIGWWGSLWVFLMAFSYIGGAILEAVQWPVIVSHGFWRLSWHEIFHLCVMAGTTAHTVLIIKYVLPSASDTSARKITVDHSSVPSHNHTVARGAIPPALDRF